jgi:uncharacterized protein (DUF427 family)
MTTTREPRLPGPDHPIDITPFEGRVVVRVGDHVVADSRAALELRESTYPPVLYVPIADLDASVLRASDTSTYCPYKGDASYYTIATSAEGHAAVADAVWYYPQPYPSVGAIAGHAAFYPDRVQISVETA